MNTHHQRGQAFMETMIYLPLFIFLLFGIIWSQKSVLNSERMETALRYAGTISAKSNPSNELTISSLYDSTNGVMRNSACPAPPTEFISGSDLFQGVNIDRSLLWQAPVSSSSCANVVVGLSGSGLTRDVLLIGNDLEMTTNIPSVSSNLIVNELSSSFAFSENARYIAFREPNLTSLTTCFPTLESALASSLWEGARGTSDGTPEFVATNQNWNVSAPTTPLQMDGKCVTSKPAGFTPHASVPFVMPTDVPPPPSPAPVPTSPNANASSGIATPMPNSLPTIPITHGSESGNSPGDTES